mgnify:CR=1 FL=1
MDANRESLKKILIFCINRDLINIGRNQLICMEQSRMDKDLFEFNRKKLWDEINSCIRNLTSMIEEGL